MLLSSLGARDLPERQQTINATVAWSYQLLDEKERHAFRRFGALPGRFSTEAAAAVLSSAGPERGGDALAATAGLIDKSLLHRESMRQRPDARCIRCSKPHAPTPRSELAAMGERDRGAARDWRAIASAKPRAPKKG